MIKLTNNTNKQIHVPAHDNTFMSVMGGSIVRNAEDKFDWHPPFGITVEYPEDHPKHLNNLKPAESDFVAPPVENSAN